MSTNLRLVTTLLELHKSAGSGILRVERDAVKKQLVLRQGLLAFAESNVPNEHLARIMIAMDLMPRAKMNEITSLMKEGKTSEEAVLEVSKSAQCLEKGRLEQATIILASLLGLENSSLHFYPGEDLIRCRVSLNLALPEMLVLSARRAVSDRLIPLPPHPLRGTVSIAEAFGGEMMNFPLNSAESFALSLASEPTEAADLLPLIPPVEANPEEVLLRLFVLGLINLEAHPGAKSGKTPSAAEQNPLVWQVEDMLARAEAADLYEILSVRKDASQDEIQSSYHKLAKQFHPDHFQSGEFSSGIRSKAERLFTFINAAYTTLSDPAARASYDEKRLTTESNVGSALKSRAAAEPGDEQIAEALFREGRISLANGDFEKAAELLKNCVWLQPEKASYHHYLGVAQSEIPKLRKEAEQHLLKAIQLGDTSPDSHLTLAKLYIEVKLPRKAEMQLQQATRWDPENPEVLRLFEKLKKIDTARSETTLRFKRLFPRK